MIAIALTIAPIFLLIMTGYVFKRTGFLADDFWRAAERLSYYVLLPVLIVRNLARADLSHIELGTFAIVLLLLAVAMALVILVVKPLLRLDGPAYTSVFQGVVRLNSYVGFAVAEAVFGSQGLVIASLFVAIMIPMVNVISITVMAAIVSTDGRPGFRNVPREIARNPIIIACALGGLINAVSLPLPEWLLETLSILGRAALPVALLCVGAGLIVTFERTRVVGLGVACILKLVVMPLIAAPIALHFGLHSLVFAVVMMFSATPASPASYVLARQLGGDAPLMAAILSLQTLLAAVAVPIVVYWAKFRMGLP